MFLTINTSRTEENANTMFRSHEVLDQSRNEQLGEKKTFLRDRIIQG